MDLVDGTKIWCASDLDPQISWEYLGSWIMLLGWIWNFTKGLVTGATVWKLLRSGNQFRTAKVSDTCKVFKEAWVGFQEPNLVLCCNPRDFNSFQHVSTLSGVSCPSMVLLSRPRIPTSWFGWGPRIGLRQNSFPLGFRNWNWPIVGWCWSLEIWKGNPCFWSQKDPFLSIFTRTPTVMRGCKAYPCFGKQMKPYSYHHINLDLFANPNLGTSHASACISYVI